MPQLEAVGGALPNPPYPNTTRCNGWRFQMDTQRLRASRTWSLAPDELRPWLLLLWVIAWDEIPAGSYEADDELIAAKLRMPLTMFQTHRVTLMRGWRRHSDGRLYHSHITTMVLERIEWKEAEAARKKRYRLQQMSHGTLPDRHGTPPDSTGEDDAGVGVGVGVKTKTKTKTPARKLAVSLPDGFAISQRVREWAEDKGHTDLDRHLESFIAYAARNGKKYVDWDAALQSAIRENWAKLEPAKPSRKVY